MTYTLNPGYPHLERCTDPDTVRRRQRRRELAEQIREADKTKSDLAVRALALANR